MRFLTLKKEKKVKSTKRNSFLCYPVDCVFQYHSPLTEYPMFVCGFVATPLDPFGSAFAVSPSFMFFSLFFFSTICLPSAFPVQFRVGQKNLFLTQHHQSQAPVWLIGHLKTAEKPNGKLRVRGAICHIRVRERCCRKMGRICSHLH